MSEADFPAAAEIVGALESIKANLDGDYIDVRLQVFDGGDWAIRSGDPQYDLDHTGFWGCGSICEDTDCKVLAQELVDEASEAAAMAGELD
jgi:hypothetical protein